ncbi:MAG TPA: type II toxin-antitoxin system RelE/ParE family toxin [Longimicrobium sp.]|nr:type II toxin-antitoxin system RelE/ParE family toxin [Longimicrobium sp.]
MRVEISPGASEAFLEAQAEYRKISKQVARRFAAEMRRVWRQIRTYPRSGTPLGELRRVVLTRFPYSLLYEIDGNVIRVTAIRRQEQEPDYWADDDV